MAICNNTYNQWLHGLHIQDLLEEHNKMHSYSQVACKTG